MYLFEVSKSATIEGLRDEDIEKQIIDKFENVVDNSTIKNKRVGICIGSRKIDRLGIIFRTLFSALQKYGANICIIPAMGSHGLDSLEIEKKIIMDRLQSTKEESKQYTFLSDYKEMDYLIPLNRIKPHTAFSSNFGSGIMKILTVGLGRTQGAREAHRIGVEKYITNNLENIKERVIFALAVVENEMGQLCYLDILRKEEIEIKEREIYKLAEKCSPKLTFDCNMLITKRIGKDISGTGIDLNIIGQERRVGKKGRVDVVCALELSSSSLGNGYGFGFCDVITKKLFNSIDFSITRMNSLATGCEEAIKPKYVAQNDFTAIKLSLSLCKHEKEIKIVLIEDSSSLGKILVSKNLIEQAENNGYNLISEKELSFEKDNLNLK